MGRVAPKMKLKLSLKLNLKLKCIIIRSILCDYSDAYILVKGTVAVSNAAAADADLHNRNKNNT